jgi:hypothetical protein
MRSRKTKLRRNRGLLNLDSLRNGMVKRVLLFEMTRLHCSKDKTPMKLTIMASNASTVSGRRHPSPRPMADGRNMLFPQNARRSAIQFKDAVAHSLTLNLQEARADLRCGLSLRDGPR